MEILFSIFLLSATFLILILLIESSVTKEKDDKDEFLTKLSNEDFYSVSLEEIDIAERKSYLLSFCQTNDLLNIEPEDENPNRGYALAIKYNHQIIGFVPKTEVDFVAGILYRTKQRICFVETIEYTASSFKVSIKIPLFSLSKEELAQLEKQKSQ